MYVKVKFFRKSANGYVGNAYTYEPDLPLRGKNRAIVTEVNVPQSEIDPAYFPLKRITEYDKEAAEDGNN